MNRVTAVLLATGALLVHMLALYRDEAGSFAVPYESSYAAFRLARNLAHEGTFVWNVGTGEGGLASYPSLLWILLGWVAEQLWWPAPKLAQIFGVLTTLATVAISTRFDTDRIAGVVPALLLVSCAALATAGPSGTEWSLVTFLVVTAFVAQEKRRRHALPIALALLVIARPEGVLIVALLGVQCAIVRGPRALRSYVPAALLFLAVGLMGARYPALLLDLFTPSGARVREGLAALSDFTRVTVSPFLVIIPLLLLAFGKLSGTGRRALAIAFGWVAIVVLEGGGPWALQLAFVPALPVLFVAVQQGIARALDTYRPVMERVAWIMIGLAVSGSLLMSRFPGDLGPLGLSSLYADWLTPSAKSPVGHPEAIGRVSLHHEIQLTREARRVALFARDHLPKEASILTPWPGAIGYLARLRVIDLYGRTQGLGGEPEAAWWPTTRPAQLLAGLALRPDYILPGLAQGAASLGGLSRALVAELLPEKGAGDGVTAEEKLLLEALADYELVACASTVDLADRRPIHLLRRVAPGTQPHLRLRRDGELLRVEVQPPRKGPPLYAHLELQLERAGGVTSFVGPNGQIDDVGARVARTDFMIRSASDGDLELGEFRLPEDTVRVRGRLALPTPTGDAARYYGSASTLEW